MNKEITKRLDKIKKLNLEIESLRDQCSHENITGRYKSNTGNWCPSDDSYWIEANCLDCGKRITADSKEDSELYRKLSLSGKVER